MRALLPVLLAATAAAATAQPNPAGIDWQALPGLQIARSEATVGQVARFAQATGFTSAAERAGKPALAQFLSELEPILRGLANGDDAALGGAALAREQIRSRDLLYRLRALQTLQTAPTQTL